METAYRMLIIMMTGFCLFRCMKAGKTLYPWTGFEKETGEDIGIGFNINIPLPQGSDDEAFESVFTASPYLP